MIAVPSCGKMADLDGVDEKLAIAACDVTYVCTLLAVRACRERAWGEEMYSS